MNERIQELARQADAYAWQQIDEGADYDKQPQFFAGKFAELIVNECIELIKKEENMPPEAISPKEWHQYAVVFKEHFGMK